MSGDGQSGRGDGPRPGVFRSWFQAFVTTVAYILLSFIAVFTLGIWAGVAYEFFLWGWHWFQ